MKNFPLNYILFFSPNWSGEGARGTPSRWIWQSHKIEEAWVPESLLEVELLIWTRVGIKVFPRWFHHFIVTTVEDNLPHLMYKGSPHRNAGPVLSTLLLLFFKREDGNPKCYEKTADFRHWPRLWKSNMTKIQTYPKDYKGCHLCLSITVSLLILGLQSASPPDFCFLRYRCNRPWEFS